MKITINDYCENKTTFFSGMTKTKLPIDDVSQIEFHSQAALSL
jgi:hypothetical protein